MPGCIVLDVRLPGRSGLEFQRELTRSGVELPVVFVSGHGDIPMYVTEMKAGAIEFLTKPFRDQDFLAAHQRGIDLDRGRRAASAILAVLRERLRSLTQSAPEHRLLSAAGNMTNSVIR